MTRRRAIPTAAVPFGAVRPFPQPAIRWVPRASRSIDFLPLSKTQSKKEMPMTFAGKPLIAVQSSTVELGNALPEYARARVRQVAAKYLGDLTGAAVYFSRDGASYRCTVNIQMGSLRIVTGETVGPDCRRAFDGALEKAVKQLRRRKRSLRDDKPFGPDKDALLHEGLHRA
jgi:ribosomal subunit interface protein